MEEGAGRRMSTARLQIRHGDGAAGRGRSGGARRQLANSEGVQHLKSPAALPAGADRLCEMGRYGQKTGAGWYQYDENRDRSPTRKSNPLIESAAAQGIKRRASPQKRSWSGRSTPCQRGREDFGRGHALRAVDIDIIYSTATASRRGAADRCGTGTPSA